MQKPIIDTDGLPCADYEFAKHVNLSIQWNRWLLKPMGLWPNSRSASGARRCLCSLTNAVCYSLIGFLFVPCTIYVCLEIEDLYTKMKQFGPLSFCLVVFIKYYSIIVHEDDIRECVRRIEWDWRNIRYPEDREIMITNAIFGRRLVILCTFFMYSGFAFYYIAIPISMGRIPTDDQNYTHIFLPLPFTRYILDAYRSPANEIIFSVQLVGGSLIHGITAAACSLAAALVVHACGQMKVLMNWLDHLIDGRSDMSKSVDGRIASIVRHHVRILKCVHRLFLITLWFHGHIRSPCIESKLVQVAGNSSVVTAIITETFLLAVNHLCFYLILKLAAVLYLRRFILQFIL